MKPTCPNPSCSPALSIRVGTYSRKSDSQVIQRYRCRCCNTTFSDATGTPCYQQKKRTLNPQLLDLLSSGMSQNRLARILSTTRVTVARKLVFLGQECSRRNSEFHASLPLATMVQFDELETFEHTKCKPLSVALAVEKWSRRILGFRVSSMPAKGPLTEIARRKYGPRPDLRSKGLSSLLTRVSEYCSQKLDLMSDKCPRYSTIVQNTLGAKPGRELRYRQTKGARGCITGQGELKKLRYDPLYSLNHTCAMLRANINRLFRRTWNTTKKVERLEMHLEIYTFFHNTKLIKFPNSTTSL